MQNKRTCLYDKHVALGAQMVPFGGFDMPIQYAGIIDEHNAVRSHCGVFDVSHMCEVVISGRDAEKFVNHIFTNDVRGLEVGKVLYGIMCYPDGGAVDDMCICKLDNDMFLMTINAANMEKDYEWIRKNSDGFDVVIQFESEHYGLLAVQGPEAEQKVEEVLNIPCKDLPFYEVRTVSKFDDTVIISRTGYTGEDGFEIYGTHDFIRELLPVDSDAATPCASKLDSRSMARSSQKTSRPLWPACRCSSSLTKTNSLVKKPFKNRKQKVLLSSFAELNSMRMLYRVMATKC